MSTSPYLLRVDEHGLLACHIDKRGNALARSVSWSIRLSSRS